MIYAIVIDVCYRPLLGIYCFLSRLIEFVETNYILYYFTNAVYNAALANYKICLEIEYLNARKIGKYTTYFWF